jgi:hypothetical protein
MSDKKRGIGDLWPAAWANAARAAILSAGIVLACMGVDRWSGPLVLAGAVTLAIGGLWIVAVWRD